MAKIKWPEAKENKVFEKKLFTSLLGGYSRGRKFGIFIKNLKVIF